MYNSWESGLFGDSVLSARLIPQGHAFTIHYLNNESYSVAYGTRAWFDSRNRRASAEWEIECDKILFRFFEQGDKLIEDGLANAATLNLWNREIDIIKRARHKDLLAEQSSRVAG